jgi:hypothetical protein
MKHSVIPSEVPLLQPPDKSLPRLTALPAHYSLMMLNDHMGHMSLSWEPSGERRT